MIGVIGAMEQEMNAIISNLENYQVVEYLHCKFHVGTINNKEIVVSQSGMGKVAVSVAAALLIEHFHPDLLINVGLCGGNGEYVKKGDFVLINKAAYHDVDCSINDSYVYGQMQGNPVIFDMDKDAFDKAKEIYGDIKVTSLLTGDCFITTQDYVPGRIAYFKTYEDFHPGCFDMEGAAVCQVCYQTKTPLLILKKVSDTINNQATDAQDQYNEYLQAKFSSSNVLFDLVRNYLK